MTDDKVILYEVRNTIDEYGHEEVVARCKTLDEAKVKLRDCCDWYRERGTGRIYKVTKATKLVTIRSRKVFEV